MISQELRNLSDAEIGRKLREQRDELITLRLKQGAGQVENTSRFRELRRGIARLETLLRQKAHAAVAK